MSIEINETHLGNTATREDAERFIAAMQDVGEDVCYGCGANWPDANSDERARFERVWDRVLDGVAK